MNDYLHGYQSVEQERLCKQAEFLRHTVHPHLRLLPGQSALEIGCGVGAQLKILAEERSARLTGVDRSAEQLDKAHTVLQAEVARGQVNLVLADAVTLPFDNEQFDQIFIFFVLEHVTDPLALVLEAKRVLKAGGRLTITEVHNPSLFVYPACPDLDAYWAAYNRLQIDLGGDPCVGVKLPNLGLKAEMKIVDCRPIGPVLDARTAYRGVSSGGSSAESLDSLRPDQLGHLRTPQAQRQAHVDFWIDLFSSVRTRLEAEGRVRPEISESTFNHLRSLADNLDSLLHYAGCQIELSH